MKHLLLVLVIWITRLVAGLPRLYYIDKDSASILQKSDSSAATLTRDIGTYIPELIRRAGSKAGTSKGSIGRNIPSIAPSDNLLNSKQTSGGSPRTLDPPKQQTSAATTKTEAKNNPQSHSQQQLQPARAAVDPKSKSDYLPPNRQQTNSKQQIKVGTQPKSQQDSKDESKLAFKNKPKGGSQAKLKSTNAALATGDPAMASKSKASASGANGLSNKEHAPKLGKGSPKQRNTDRASTTLRKSSQKSRKQDISGGVHKPSPKSASSQQNGANNKQGSQKGLSKAQKQQGLRSQGDASGDRRMTRSKTASATTGKPGKRPADGRASTLNVKERSAGGKGAQGDNKRSAGELTTKSNKAASQKKRICRRADRGPCEEWDIEMARPSQEGPSTSRERGSTNQAAQLDGQSTTSSAPLIPPLIRTMSRTGREYAKANPWTATAFALSATSAALGNAAGVTDDCCNEECARTASHVLNYCGMTAGVIAAGAAFTSAAITHHNNKQKQEEQDKKVERLKMKTEGHDAALRDHGEKIDQTEKKFSTEIKRTKQTLSQVTQRIGGPRLPEDFI